MRRFAVACLQMNSGDRVDDNLRQAADLLQQAAAADAKLAVLPEFFPLLCADETAKLSVAERDGDGVVQRFLADAAKRHGFYVLGGTLPIIAECDDDGRTRKVFSASLLYAPDGARVARYDKIHLFQFTASGGAFYDETATICAGDEVVTADTAMGRLGLSVCYDLRFPELYRMMRQPDFIAAPSAFVPETGKAHWELLLRARAVENLAYVFGAAQAGEHPGGRKTYGDTMIVNPWGRVLAWARGDGGECVVAVVDADEQREWRRRQPALDNRRFFPLKV